MDIEDFLEIAKTYSRLGWSVQEQLDEWVDGERLPSPKLNRNAVEYIKEFLEDAMVNYGITGITEEMLENGDDEEDD